MLALTPGYGMITKHAFCLLLVVQECQSLIKEGEVFEKEIGYDEDRCYEFRSRFMTNEFCPRISSDFGDVVTFGNCPVYFTNLTSYYHAFPFLHKGYCIIKYTI